LLVFSFIDFVPPDIPGEEGAHRKVRPHQWRINVGPEAVTSISKAAEVSYTDQAAAAAGTTEQRENIRSVNTNPR
jgi:hypothetical protein